MPQDPTGSTSFLAYSTLQCNLMPIYYFDLKDPVYHDREYPMSHLVPSNVHEHSRKDASLLEADAGRGAALAVAGRVRRASACAA